MSKLIAAYTPPTSPYPPYLNISREDDGHVVVIMRGPPAPGEFSDQDCGPTTVIRFPPDEWKTLIAAIKGEA